MYDITYKKIFAYAEIMLENGVQTMKKRVKIFLLAICMALSVNVMSSTVFAKPSIFSETACVLDVQSGAILYEKNKDQKEYPASITKIMTALIAIENSSMDEEIVYTDNAFANWESGASNAGIKVGERISMEESLYAVMLASANEACNGVAEHVSGSIDDFVKKMNQKAKELGCKNTHFANTNGLWKKNHYTTAYDIALIGRAAIRNKDFKTIAGTKTFIMSKTNKNKRGPSEPLVNHHKMINPADYPQYEYEYCEGGKTGYTSKSRNTLVTFAKKGDMELVCAVMKCNNSVWLEPNAYTDTTKLFNYCFEKYEKTKIQDNAASEINEQYLFTNFSPFYSKQTSCLHIDEDAGVILPKGVSIDKAEKKIEYYDKAVEQEGKKVIGKLSYTYKGQEVGATNIYFDENDSPTLRDSIDMSKWFDEAIETASKPPLPWKKIALLIILACCIIGVSILCFLKLREYQVKTDTRNGYKKTKGHLGRKERDYYIDRSK